MIDIQHHGDGFIPVWTPPKKLPSLRGCKYVAVDTETMDHSIQAGKGAGGAKGMGYMLGVSIATDKGFTGYFDTRHFELEKIREWARNELTRKSLTKIYANGLYDIEWFHHHDIPFDIANTLDVQIMEPLIDSEKRTFNLDSLAKKYLGPEFQKAKGHLEEMVSMYLGKKVNSKTMWQYLDKVPPEAVGGYAEMDALITLKVAMEQLPIIKAEGLEAVMDLERRQWPLLLEMRIRGVRVDENTLDKNHTFLFKRAEKLTRKLSKIAGFDVNIAASSDLAKVYEKVGLEIVRTAKGNPSFDESVLLAQKHPVNDLILLIRKDESAMKFTHAIMDHLHNGRIHGHFNQLKSDNLGTVSGRYSASNPNLQNQPGKRNPEMGALLRGCYIPEEDCDWSSKDYDQIEFRLIVDYAARTGLKMADHAMQAYIEDPKTDFHAWVMRLTGLSRPQAKCINFGLAYRMGKPKLAHDLGLSPKEAEEIFKVYHGEVPFVNELMRKVSMKAEKIGYIRTLSGRRRRFDLWEDGNYGKHGTLALPRDEALEKYGKIKRAYTFKAGNALVQGSAADVMKMGMADAWDAGVFEYLTPHCVVHDEINTSCPRTKEAKEASAELTRVMTSVYKDVIKVPILMGDTIGPNWWDQKDVE